MRDPATHKEVLNDRWGRIFGIPGVGLVLYFSIHYGRLEADVLPAWVQPLITILVTGIIWETIRLVVLYFRRAYPGHTRTVRRIFLQFSASLVISALLMILISYALSFLNPACWNDRDIVLLNMVSGISTTMLISIIYECVYFFQNWRSSILEAEHLKRENLQFQFETLKSQVNPHFLFNSLNTLTSLIEEEPKSAVQFVQHLSQVYRYVLMSRDKNLIALEEEMRFIRSYLFLLEMRFGKNLVVRIDIPEKNFQQQLPPLALQLLVENAIKHNVVSSEDPLTLTITVNKKGQLFVENNVRKKQSVESSSGFGLKNIINRYKLLGRSDVEIVNDTANFSVALPLL